MNLLHDYSANILGEAIDPVETQVDVGVQLLAYKSFLKIVRLMSEAEFQSVFNASIEHVWCLLLKAEPVIKSLTQLKQKDLGEDAQFTQLLHVGFDIFQFLFAKLSSGEPETSQQLQILLNGVLQSLNKEQSWRCPRFAEFLLTIMCFNGSALRLEN